MAKTEVSGKQLKDGSVELVDLAAEVSDVLDSKADTSSLATVATSGSYVDLTNKPTIPSVVGLATESYVDTSVAAVVSSAPAVLNTLNELALALGSDANFSTTIAGQIGTKANTSSLATVATSGSYVDLTNKPTIPSVVGLASETYVDTAVSTKANTSSLSTVATSGSYVDLTNKPTIPTNLDSLTDVTITTPAANQIIKYNGTAWVNSAAAAAGATTLDELTDVVIASPLRGHLVVHNGTNFVNSNTIETSGAAIKALIVKGAASQTANLLELQNSAGTVLSSFNAAGLLQINNTSSTSPILIKNSAAGGGWTAFELSVGADLRTANTTILLGSSDRNITFGFEGGTGSNGCFKIWGSGERLFELQSPDNGSGVYTLDITRNTTSALWDFNRGSSAGQGVNFNTWDGATGGVGINRTAALAASLHVQNNRNDKKGMIIQGNSGQTANLLELQNSAGTVLASVSSSGAISAGNTTLTSTAAATKGLIVKGAASQSANLLELQNSAGTAVAQFTNAGAVTFASNVTAGGTSYMPALYFGANGAGLQILHGGSTVNGVALGRDTTVGESGLSLGSYMTAGSNQMRLGWGGGSTGYSFTGLSSGAVGLGTTSPGGQFHVVAKSDMKGLIVQGAASQTSNLLELQNSAATALVSVSSAGALHAPRYTETVANAFTTTLTPSTGTLTVDTSTGSAVLGTLAAAVTTWAFTNVPTENSKVTTVTAVLVGNASCTYGDACSVNGVSVTNGIMWSGGGVPSATAGYDIIAFLIVKDSSGTILVFGSATTNFI